MLDETTIYSVSALNQYIKSLFNNDSYLKNSICVRGEISTFRRSTNGHFYFTIADDNSKIKAVMFARETLHLSFIPQEGDEVLIFGKVNVYAENGEYQIYINEMDPYGQGQALIKLEKLKKKLAKEGLFDEKHKKPIPAFPSNIGLITADGSAALEDLKKNIRRRYPLVNIYLFPAIVQGEKAPKSLINALLKAESYPLDTIIIGRGGGSNEDLSAFNDEGLVRAIFACPIPVISAVGHEIDYTLADLVSDCRVSTPTAAAEKATPDIGVLHLKLDNLQDRLERIITQRIDDLKNRLLVLKKHSSLSNPLFAYQHTHQRIDMLKKQLQTIIFEALKEKAHDLKICQLAFNTSSNDFFKNYRTIIKNLEIKLTTINPQAVLDRGYSYISDENGNIIESIQSIEVHQRIKTTLKDGVFTSIVSEKEDNHEKRK